MRTAHAARFTSVVAGLLLATVSAAWAHGNQPHDAALPREQQLFGIAGEPAKITRTVQISMGDNMRFTPDRIEVRAGETLRLRIRNSGRLLHELVIGTPEQLDEHAALMRRFPNMEHAEAHMAHVPAGKSGDLIWNFNRAGSFDFACLIDGHYQAGMRGQFIVTPASKENQHGKN